MSRVHCIDCGSAVVVDPSGFCPDGHHVGADGARIEAAIGVAVPYPDEPEPWVASVDLAPGDGPATTDGGAARARAARPPSVPAGGPAAASPAEASTAASTPPTATPFTVPHDRAPATAPPATNGHSTSDSPDDLLRELHSLAELDDWAAPAAPTAPAHSPSAPTQSAPTHSPAAPSPAAPSPAPHPAPAHPSPAHPAPTHSAPTSPAPASPPATNPASTFAPEPAATDADVAPPLSDGQHRNGLAELRALEAAVHALTGSSMDELGDAAPEPSEPEAGVVHRLPAPEPASPQETPDREELAEVEQLFAHRPRRMTGDEPAPRPSQTTPPAENEPPRPAFQRTPWAPEGTDGTPATGSPTTSPAGSEPPASHPTTPPPAAAPAPQVEVRTSRSEAEGSSDAALDIGNFTAKGNRVGGRGEGRRRRRGR